MTIDSLVSAFVTLLVTIDPLGLTPIFASLTAGMDPSERSNVALRASITAFIILTCFLIAGESLLRSLGISFSAVRISGGLLLFWISFEMIFERRGGRKQRMVDAPNAVDRRILAIFPLATPLMAGPGAITAIILLSSKIEHDYLAKFMLTVIVALVITCCLLLFLVATRLTKFLGESCQVLVSRLMGLILAALAVQFAIDGVKDVIGNH